MKLFVYTFSLLAIIHTSCLAQIGFGGQPHPSAVLDLKSPANDKGFLPPRLTTSQRNSIANPAAGLLVFDTDRKALYLFDGQTWRRLTTTDPGLLQQPLVTASDGEAGDEFGSSIAIAGDYAFITAHGDNINGNAGQGSVYVFARSGNTWTQQAKLVANDGAAGDHFGTRVAVSGDYLWIGSFFDDIGNNIDQGSVYVFARSGNSWTQQAKLVADDGGANDHFGFNLAVTGDKTIIGAYSNIGNNTHQGAAYIFVLSGNSWVQQAKLTANDGEAFDYFGCTVAISGDTAFVGAYYDDIGPNIDQGSVYIFTRSGTNWTQQAKLLANDGAADDHFGNLTLNGDYLIIGALKDDIGNNVDQGSVYIFTKSGTSWIQQSKLTANDGAAGDNFGVTVAMAGNYLIIGALYDDINTNVDQGSAYIFTYKDGQWSLLQKLTDTSSTPYTYNGWAVAIANDGTFIVGGRGFDSNKGKVAFGTVD